MSGELIIIALKEIIAKLAPDVHYVHKYGGELVEITVGDSTKQIAGIFAYTEHVSLEFSSGAYIDDAHGLLEGKGKHRRHLKFRSLDDIHTKNAEAYLQAVIDYAKA